MAGVSRHRAAAAQTGDPARPAVTHNGSGANLRSDFYPDAGRPGLSHRNDEPLHLPYGFPVFQFWLCRRNVVPGPRAHGCVCAIAQESDENSAMKSAARYALAGVALAAALVPIYWLITISIKRDIDQFAFPPLWFHFQPTWRHYIASFADGSFGRY